jgi:PAS domain-containing protein
MGDVPNEPGVLMQSRVDAEPGADAEVLPLALALSVLDSIPNPLFVKDLRHRRVFVNDAWCAFTGRTREAVFGKSDHDLFPRAIADNFCERDRVVFEEGRRASTRSACSTRRPASAG